MAPLPPRLDQQTSPDRRPDLVADTAAIGSGFTIKGTTFEKHLSDVIPIPCHGTREPSTTVGVLLIDISAKLNQRTNSFW